jgi:DNA-binding HxlR family transcriptional regulator
MEKKGNAKKTTWAEDEDVESVVLRQLLDLHPTQLTLTELVREIGGNRGGFAEHDAIERAVRELAAVGLLHRGDEFVTPTRAALRFSELLDR